MDSELENHPSEEQPKTQQQVTDGLLTIKKASNLSEESVSFNQLLLGTIQSTYKDSQNDSQFKKRKTKTTAGAEVITANDVADRLQKMQSKKAKKTRYNEDEFDRDIENEIEEEIMEEDTDAESAETFSQWVEKDATQLEELDRTLGDKKDWILVKFATKKTIKYFMGQIISIRNMGEPTVKFTQKNIFFKKSIFKFPTNENIICLQILSEVSEDTIIRLLSAPKEGRRGETIFDLS